MNLYVPDASVAAKWFLPEDQVPVTQESLVPAARRILEGYAEGSIGLLVPELFWAEIGHMLEGRSHGTDAEKFGGASARQSRETGISNVFLRASARGRFRDCFRLQPACLRRYLCGARRCGLIAH